MTVSLVLCLTICTSLIEQAGQTSDGHKSLAFDDCQKRLNNPHVFVVQGPARSRFCSLVFWCKAVLQPMSSLARAAMYNSLNSLACKPAGCDVQGMWLCCTSNPAMCLQAWVFESQLWQHATQSSTGVRSRLHNLCCLLRMLADVAVRNKIYIQIKVLIKQLEVFGETIHLDPGNWQKLVMLQSWTRLRN